MMRQVWLDGPTYDDLLRYNRLIFLSLLGLPVCVVGIVTSGLSICMFCEDKTTPRTTRKLLIILSLTDVLYIFLCILVFQPMNFCSRDCPLRWPVITHTIVPLGSILEGFRNLLVVLIAVERFLVVRFPFRSKVWWNGKLTNGLIAATFGFSVLLRLSFICYAAVKIVRPEWSELKSWLWQIHCFTDGILVTLIPLIILIVCSLQIGRCQQRSIRFQRGQTEKYQTFINGTSKGSASSNARRLKLTHGLLIVIGTFVLFMLPLSMLQLLYLYFLLHRTCISMVCLNICANVVALGSQINSTANFFVYIVYWGKYRKMLRQMLRCQKSPQFVFSSRECTNSQQ
ncbi:unnamed protein product [Dibothriocephalus latus]|uniref:G-protein coupled receptors family 1 profile domain-containing protein n=1 Tax=Dibothriocephalus latus TaxID=60516 RepID=A0A3P7L5B8_DIBLA|nr:unnamed protein product [Dibothriocephalus latus]